MKSSQPGLSSWKLALQGRLEEGKVFVRVLRDSVQLAGCSWPAPRTPSCRHSVLEAVLLEERSHGLLLSDARNVSSMQNKMEEIHFIKVVLFSRPFHPKFLPLALLGLRG